MFVGQMSCKSTCWKDLEVSFPEPPLAGNLDHSFGRYHAKRADISGWGRFCCLWKKPPLDLCPNAFT